jgi:hypothetical protein
MPKEPIDYTMRNQIRTARVNFKYYVQTRQLIQNGEKVGLNIFHPDNDVSIVRNLNVGAVNTTVSEYNQYIEEVQPDTSPPPTTPSPPTSLSATPGNTTVTISFTLGSDGGSPITNYQYSTDGGATFTAFSPAQTSSPVSITGLTNGVTYDIQLKAVNAVGPSVASASVTTTPVTVPSPPTSLSATSGNMSASISFTPGSDGGSAITNYQYSINNGSTYTAFSPAQTSSPVSITGLTNGVVYNIKLKTVTVVDVSSASATVSVTPAAPATVPSPPTALSSVGGDTAAYILFTAGGNGGSAITNYEYSTDGGSTFTPFSPAQTFSPVAITGLTNSVAYDIQLKAVNAIGSSIASSSVSVTPTVNTLKTSNLILELDANNSSSYSGSGTTWTNLRSSGSYSGTLTNGPTFDSGAKTFTFDGISQYVQIADAAAIRATVGGAITAQIWANVSSSGLTGGDGLIGKQYGSSSDYDGFSLSLRTDGSLYLKMNGASVDGTYSSATGVYNTGVWALYTIVVRFGGGSGSPSYAYVSTRRVVSGSNSESSIPSNTAPLQLARGIQDSTFNFAPCQIGAFYYYNTTVSQEDIIRNYDATKSQYGL